MNATIIVLVLMILAATCLYKAWVFLAVKSKSTTVGRRTKERVLSMSRRDRQGKAALYAALALLCFVLMIVVGVLMTHMGYSM